MTQNNNLYNVKFKMNIQRIPDVTFWIQSVTLPAMSIEKAMIPGMKRDMYLPGSKVEFDQLVVNFLVDAHLDNYYELYNWFLEMVTTDNIQDVLSTCSLHFLDGNNRVSRIIDIVGAYPATISELAMNSDDTDLVPVTCSLTFDYQYFKFADKPIPIFGTNQNLV